MLHCNRSLLRGGFAKFFQQTPWHKGVFMKNKRIWLIIVPLALACFLLASCLPSDLPNPPSNNNGGDNSGGGNNGGDNSGGDNNGGNGEVTETRTVDFFAINDFHGAVDNMSTVAGYLAQQKYNNPNTVVMNSGDMFQGSMESNSNYGKLLSQCMDDVGFDSFTFGNHEFDWGIPNLQKLAQSSSTPFLGANIYHWDAKTREFGTFASELAQEYVVKTLPNGLKVGIIGIIGPQQITSICSNLVQNIGFKDFSEVIPALSQKLRGELGCNVVVVSAHTGQSTFLDDDTFDVTQYADAVFCAHTHREETATKNGVPFIQGKSYGQYVSHVRLAVSAKGAVSAEVSENVARKNSWPNKITVQTLIDNSNKQIQAEAKQVLANFNNSLSAYTGVPRLVCHAIANYVSNNYADYDVALAMVNQGRSAIDYGELTYSELYQAIPFDNTVYIANVSGADIFREVEFSGTQVWRINGQAIENSNTKFYKIAVIDYLLFHQNDNREYDAFPSVFAESNTFTPVALENSNYDIYNYRFITRDFLINNKNVSAADYEQDNDYNNKDKLSSAVSLAAILPNSAQAQAPIFPQTLFVANVAVLPKNVFYATRIAAFGGATLRQTVAA